MKKIIIDVISTLLFMIFWVVFYIHIFELINFGMYLFNKIVLIACLVVLIPFGIQFFRVGAGYFYFRYIWRGELKARHKGKPWKE